MKIRTTIPFPSLIFLQLHSNNVFHRWSTEAECSIGKTEPICKSSQASRVQRRVFLGADA
jgi:hypothetical protein